MALAVRISISASIWMSTSGTHLRAPFSSKRRWSTSHEMRSCWAGGGERWAGTRRSPFSFLRHQRHRPTPTGASPFDLHRQTRDVKAVWSGNLLQIGELFDLTILARKPREVGRPDKTAVAGAAVVGDHVGERPIQGVGVDADDAHALL